MKNFEEKLKKVEGNLMHEGMILTDYEKELIKKVVDKEITRPEFIKQVVDFHKEALEKERSQYSQQCEDLKPGSLEREVGYGDN